MAKQATNTEFEKQLREMDERWKANKEEAKKNRNRGEGTTAGYGKHRCRLSAARLVSVQKDKKTLLKPIMEWTVVDGDETGEKATIWYNLETDEQRMFFQRDLIKLGEDLDTISAPMIPGILAKLLKTAPTARISVVKNEGYTQPDVYLDKLMAAEPGDVAPAQPEPAPATRGKAAAAAAAAPEETNGEYSEGDAVQYQWKNERLAGVCKEIRASDATVQVETDDTPPKLRRVKANAVTKLLLQPEEEQEEEEEEEEEE